MRPIDFDNLVTLADDSLDASSKELRSNANHNSEFWGREKFIGAVMSRNQLDPYPRLNELEISADQDEIAFSFNDFLNQKSTEASVIFGAPSFNYVVELKNVCLRDNEIRFPEIDWATLLENLHPAKIVRPEKARPSEPAPENQTSDDWPTLYLSCPGGPNWGHFVLEDLPRAVQFVSTVSNEKYRIVMIDFDGINPGINHKRAEMLISLFPEKEIDIRFHKPTDLAMYESIWYVSPVGVHPGYHWPQGYVDLRDQAFKHFPKTRITPKKLLVLRRDNRLPVAEDLAKLIEWSEKSGYLAIYPEDYSGLEQAWLFGSAAQIIGLSGGAMTNIVFGKPGVRLFTIAPDSWRVFLYRDLAAIRKSRFQIHYGTSIDSSYANERNFNYSLNFNRLIPALERFDQASN